MSNVRIEVQAATDIATSGDIFTWPIGNTDSPVVPKVKARTTKPSDWFSLNPGVYAYRFTTTLGLGQFKLEAKVDGGSSTVSDPFNTSDGPGLVFKFSVS